MGPDTARKCSNQKHEQHEGTNATSQQSRPESRSVLAVKTIVVSPMQDIPPPPCPVASTPKLQLALYQAAPALQLLLGKFIIEKNAIAPEAAALTKQCTLGQSIWEPQVPEVVACAASFHGL